MTIAPPAEWGVEDDAVLSASYLAPRTAGATLHRSRLLDRLDRAVRHSVCLVSGEPASGKTTLVADWIRSDPGRARPSVWLTVPPELGDELLFWRYVLAAIAQLGVPIDDLQRALIDREPPTDGWLSTLANRLGAVEGDPVVVIDDLHELESEAALASLRDLVERLPPGVSCLVTTRAKPAWPLPRWRMSGQLDEIDADELRFTPDETVALIREVGELDMSVDDIALLHRRTEGWAGGIWLALLSLQRTSDPSGFLERLAADDELVSTYLFREVLHRQDPEVREFLLTASMLDDLSPEVCDAVRDRNDSAELLERCIAGNLFVVGIGGPDRRYRLHTLFAALLRATFETTEPDRCRELRQRASDVYEQRGELGLAITAATAAGDDARVGGLIARHAASYAHRGRFDEMRSWSSALRSGVVARLPETMLGLASALSLSGRHDDALHLLDELMESDPDARVCYVADQLRGCALMSRGDVHRLRGVADRLAATGTPPGDLAVPFDEVRLASYLEGVGSYFDGDLAAAGAALERATRRVERPGLFYVESPGWSARVALAAGRLSAAEHAANESIARGEELGSAETAVLVPARLTLADVAWERNRLDDAADHLAIAGRSVRPLLWESILVACSTSRLTASTGDPDTALAELEEVGRIYLGSDGAPPLRAVVAGRALELSLQAGRFDTAAAWSRVFTDCAERAAPPSQRIRLAAAGDERGLEQIVAEALTEHQTTPHRIDTLLAVAEVEDAAGDRDAARARVAEAAELAGSEGFVRRFCDAGAAVVGALTAMVDDPGLARSVSPFVVAKLADACAATVRVVPPVERHADGLVEQLSAREVEVLDLLAAGLSYTEIGTKLFVSRNTVKSHVRHVYTKLGVASRSAAIDAAGRLGLVDR